MSCRRGALVRQLAKRDAELARVKSELARIEGALTAAARSRALASSDAAWRPQTVLTS